MELNPRERNFRNPGQHIHYHLWSDSSTSLTHSDFMTYWMLIMKAPAFVKQPRCPGCNLHAVLNRVEIMSASTVCTFSPSSLPTLTLWSCFSWAVIRRVLSRTWQKHSSCGSLSSHTPCLPWKCVMGVFFTDQWGVLISCIGTDRSMQNGPWEAYQLQDIPHNALYNWSWHRWCGQIRFVCCFSVYVVTFFYKI